MYYLFLTIIPTAFYALTYINKLPHIDDNDLSQIKFSKNTVINAYKEVKYILFTFT